MSDKNNTRNLSSIINGCLPYEYDVTLHNYHGKTPSILITKEDSNHIMQITPNEHDNTCTVLTWIDGDDPDTGSETLQWNIDSPDVTLDSILTDIKNRL